MEKPQQTVTETRHHATPEEIEQMKTHLGHIFDVDELGNLTLKPHFNIPPFKMIFVKKGTSTMGDKMEGDNPSHFVELTYNFFIGEFPVIQELYFAVTGKNLSNFKGINHPVEKVNWKEAMEFCNLLNNMIGLEPLFNQEYELIGNDGIKTTDFLKVSGFRLPTETEWEYAATGGASACSTAAIGLLHGLATEYPGSSHLDEVGWYDKNNQYETKPVGLKFPNQLDVYDMSGNVWEWCLDWYDGDFYQLYKKQENPLNLKVSSNRVLRGGSWNNYADYCRTANRQGSAPDQCWFSSGFRLLFAFQFT